MLHILCRRIRLERNQRWCVGACCGISRDRRRQAVGRLAPPRHRRPTQPRTPPSRRGLPGRHVRRLARHPGYKACRREGQEGLLLLLLGLILLVVVVVVLLWLVRLARRGKGRDVGRGCGRRRRWRLGRVEVVLRGPLVRAVHVCGTVALGGGERGDGGEGEGGGGGGGGGGSGSADDWCSGASTRCPGWCTTTATSHCYCYYRRRCKRGWPTLYIRPGLGCTRPAGTHGASVAALALSASDTCVAHAAPVPAGRQPSPTPPPQTLLSAVAPTDRSCVPPARDRCIHHVECQKRRPRANVTCQRVGAPAQHSCGASCHQPLPALDRSQAASTATTDPLPGPPADINARWAG